MAEKEANLELMYSEFDRMFGTGPRPRAYFAPGDDITGFFAREAGVLLEAGGMFVRHDEGFVRLNLACPKAMLLEGLRRMCDAVKRRR